MKRGLYKEFQGVERGSLLEAALLYHESLEARKDFFRLQLLAISAPLKDNRKMQKQITSLFYPSHEEEEKEVLEGQLAYIRSLQDVDWSLIFKVDPRYVEKEGLNDVDRAYSSRPEFIL